MGKRTDRRNAEQFRTLLAQEAARLICDHGISDYGTAKLKAADKLGLRNCRALPNNLEIDAAIAERNRIFAGAQHPQLLRQLRNTAARVMQDLSMFNPRLVGPVLSGNITEHSGVKIHLFCEPAENVGDHLTSIGIRHSTISQRLKLQRDRAENFPGYRFQMDYVGVETTVFPERRDRHAPLSPLDGKPMKRAKLNEVEKLASAY